MIRDGLTLEEWQQRNLLRADEACVQIAPRLAANVSSEEEAVDILRTARETIERQRPRLDHYELGITLAQATLPITRGLIRFATWLSRRL